MFSLHVCIQLKALGTTENSQFNTFCSSYKNQNATKIDFHLTSVCRYARMSIFSLVNVQNVSDDIPPMI